MFIASLITVFLASWSLTGYFRRYAILKNIIDLPNHRSSHATPTPRGGGLCFVAVFLITTACMVYCEALSARIGLALSFSGFSIAAIGFCDDLYSIPVKWRILGHLVVSGVALLGLSGMPSITLYDWTLNSTWFLNTLALFYLVWLLNLYNFMDGIDGLASIEAITVCLGISAIYYLDGAQEMIGIPMLLSAGMIGFAYWNFPPAKLFMGDVGSGFLGLIFGALSIQAAHVNEHYFWSWLILLGVFIVDATLTLFRRLLRGVKFYEAHRTHAYQHAAVFCGSHLKVSTAVFLINVVWLWPLSALVGLNLLNGLLGLLIAYCPLGILAFRFKSGLSD